MTQRGYYDPEVDSTPVQRSECFPVGEAARKARRAFWRGVTVGGLVIGACFIGGAAFGGDTANFGGTGCRLIPVTGQAHVAEVQCHNVHTMGAAFDDGVMEAGGLTVGLSVAHGPGDEPDAFVITPGSGFYADPAVLVIPEWDGATALIFEFVGA